MGFYAEHVRVRINRPRHEAADGIMRARNTFRNVRKEKLVAFTWRIRPCHSAITFITVIWYLGIHICVKCSGVLLVPVPFVTVFHFY